MSQSHQLRHRSHDKKIFFGCAANIAVQSPSASPAWLHLPGYQLLSLTLRIGLKVACRFRERRDRVEIHSGVAVGSTGWANYSLVLVRSHALIVIPPSDLSFRVQPHEAETFGLNAC